MDGCALELAGILGRAEGEGRAVDLWREVGRMTMSVGLFREGFCSLLGRGVVCCDLHFGAWVGKGEVGPSKQNQSDSGSKVFGTCLATQPPNPNPTPTPP